MWASKIATSMGFVLYYKINGANIQSVYCVFILEPSKDAQTTPQT